MFCTPEINARLQVERIILGHFELKKKKKKVSQSW